MLMLYNFRFLSGDLPGSACQLLLERFGISSQEAPIVHKTDKAPVFHSRNFRPTLEAYKRLGLDTRTICKRLNEEAPGRFIKQIDLRLHFSRNYQVRFGCVQAIARK